MLGRGVSPFLMPDLFWRSQKESDVLGGRGERPEVRPVRTTRGPGRTDEETRRTCRKP